MKRFYAFCVALLLLSGCGAAKPVDGPVTSSEAPASSVDQSAASQSASSQNTPPASSLPEMPTPDAPPVTQVGAIDLPDPVFTSTAGYGVTLLTPAQYDVYQEGGSFGGFPSGDLFILGQGGKLAIANANGKILTDFIYDDGGTTLNPWSTLDGTYTLYQQGKAGLLDARDGGILVEFKYDRVMTLPGVQNSGFHLGILGDKMEVLNSAGKAVFTLERGDDIYALGETLVMLQDGMLKFYDNKDDSPIANFSCDQLMLLTDPEQEEQRLGYLVGDKWGICDGRGKTIVSPTYEDVGSFIHQNYYAVFTQNGKKGLVDLTGKVTVKAEWDDIMAFENSVSVCKGDKWGVIRDGGTGEVTIQPMYDDIGGFGEEGLATYERGGKFGILDREGNEIVAAHSETRISSGNNLLPGYYLLQGDGGPLTSGITGGGQVILPTDHVFLSQGKYPVYAPEEPYNLVMTPRDKWGYVDGTGKFVIDAKFEDADGFIAGKEVAFVKLDGKIALIDRKGTVVLQTVFSNLVGYNPETMVCAMQYQNQAGEVKACLVKINLPA